MWIPLSKLFVNYEDAHSYFLKVSPSLDDKYNIAEHFINESYNPEDMTNDYEVIEDISHVSGYHYGEENCAKRPQGAVIARMLIRH
jgi:hypothetical protein